MSNPPLAAFGNVPISQALGKQDVTKTKTENKYKEFMNAIHAAAFNQDTLDEQTGLEWDNIEGEVMAVVLREDLISGTPFFKIEHPFFTFREPMSIIDEMFVNKFVETMKRKPFLIPSITVMKENLNRLMISLKRQGRLELIQMLQSFQVQMHEQEHSDPLKAMRRMG